MSFKYDENVVRVEIEGANGKREEVYRGTNHEKAVERANFWDERVNTYYIDPREMDYLELANDKFDALDHYIRTGENR